MALKQGGNRRQPRCKSLPKLWPKPFFSTPVWIPNSLIGQISHLRHLLLQTVCTMNVSWECCWRQLWAWQWHETPRRADSSCHRPGKSRWWWINPSDRGGASQTLPPTPSREGMRLGCSFEDNWWSVLIRCNMSEATKRHWEVGQAGCFPVCLTGVCYVETGCIQV